MYRCHFMSYKFLLNSWLIQETTFFFKKFWTISEACVHFSTWPDKANAYHVYKGLEEGFDW